MMLSNILLHHQKTFLLLLRNGQFWQRILYLRLLDTCVVLQIFDTDTNLSDGTFMDERSGRNGQTAGDVQNTRAFSWLPIYTGELYPIKSDKSSAFTPEK